MSVAFAMAVTYPAAGNIGGGGFMLVHAPGKETIVFEYRETAPAAVTRDTFAKTIDWHDHKAAGVPGTVRGLELAHKKFGKLPWKTSPLQFVWLTKGSRSMPDGQILNDAMKKSGNDEPATFARTVASGLGRRPLIQKDLMNPSRSPRVENAFYTGGLADLLVPR